MKNKITVADLVMAVGGLVTFLFSFFAFLKYEGFGGNITANAWDTDTTAFASTVPALLGLAMVVWIALELFGVSLPDQVLTFTATQLKATWGISAAGIMLSWISANDSKGFGFWLMFLGSIAMAVGAVMALLGKGTETLDLPTGGSSSPTATPTPPTPPTPPVPPTAPPAPSTPPAPPSAPPPPPAAPPAPPSGPDTAPPPPPPPPA